MSMNNKVFQIFVYHFQGAEGEQGEPGPDGAAGPTVSY